MVKMENPVCLNMVMESLGLGPEPYSTCQICPDGVLV